MNARADVYPKWTFLHAIVFWVLSTVLRRKVQKHVGAVLGGERVPGAGPLVLIANHESYFDTFAICVLFRELFGRRVWVPTKVKAFKGFWRKLVHEAWDAIAIDHAEPQEAYRKLEELLARGECVLVFPEGKRSEGQGLLPFSYGGFNMAMASGAPIVPIALHGTARVLPKGRLSFERHEKAYVELGAPLDPKTFRRAGDDGNKLAAARMRDSTRDWIEDRLATFTGPSRDDLMLAGKRMGSVMERRTEGLLEHGIELVTRRAALRVKRGIELAFSLGIRSLALEVQYTRVYGFSILGLPRVLAFLFVGRYLQLIRAGLAQQADNPYLQYCLGQYHLRVPRLLGGNRAAAVAALAAAYDAAAKFGLDAAKYVVSYATALAKVGRDADAMQLLARHFAAKPEPHATERELRRHERARELVLQLQAQVDRARSLNPVGTP